MSAVSWPKWQRELRACSSLYVIPTPRTEVNWKKIKKIPKQAAGLHSQSLHPSESDAVLEYFPSNISPSLALPVSHSDLLFMPMVTLEALWLPGECEISLAGQQPSQRHTLAGSCGTCHHSPFCCMKRKSCQVLKVWPGFSKKFRWKQRGYR